MKKIKGLLVVIGILLIVGCGKSVKEVKSINDFNNVATEKGLVVSDNIANYNASYIKEATIASLDDLEIEMIVYDNEDSANKIQDEHINSFMVRKSANMVTKKYSGSNYYKYTMITNGYYFVSSRVENTLIFTKTDVKNKEIVDSILDSLGY